MTCPRGIPSLLVYDGGVLVDSGALPLGDPLGSQEACACLSGPFFCVSALFP